MSNHQRTALCSLVQRPGFDVAALPSSDWAWKKYDERVFATIDDGWKVTEFMVMGDPYKMHHRDPTKWLVDAFSLVSKEDFEKYHTPRKKFKTVSGCSGG